jgi:4'-phosphopantetheinyl transferase
VSSAGTIVQRFFSPGERAAYAALPEDQKPEAFYRCWTGKEAYLKALGKGLVHLARFDTSFAPGKPARLLCVDGDLDKASNWSLATLDPAPGYVAALAVEGQGWDLECWQYPWPA